MAGRAGYVESVPGCDVGVLYLDAGTINRIDLHVRRRRWSQRGLAVQAESQQPSRLSSVFPPDVHEVTPDRCGTAIANKHRDVLLAAGRVADGRGVDAEPGVEPPEVPACCSIVGREITVGSTLKHKIAGCCKRAAIPDRVERDSPRLVLPNGIPGEQGALAILRIGLNILD